MRHDHLFEEPYYVNADESIVIEQRCLHREVLGQYVDHARDEVYEETGPRCEAVRRTVYEPVLVERMAEDESQPVETFDLSADDPLPAAVEDAIMAAERKINGGEFDLDLLGPALDHAADAAVWIDGYRIEYDMVEQGVSEG